MAGNLAHHVTVHPGAKDFHLQDRLERGWAKASVESPAPENEKEGSTHVPSPHVRHGWPAQEPLNSLGHAVSQMGACSVSCICVCRKDGAGSGRDGAAEGSEPQHRSVETGLEWARARSHCLLSTPSETPDTACLGPPGRHRRPGLGRTVAHHCSEAHQG